MDRSMLKYFRNYKMNNKSLEDSLNFTAGTNVDVNIEAVSSTDCSVASNSLTEKNQQNEKAMNLIEKEKEDNERDSTGRTNVSGPVARIHNRSDRQPDRRNN